MVLITTSFALAETSATPAPATKVAQTTPAATPTPNPLTVSGYFRSYYFTRQNASNNPGAEFNFSESKYSSTGVNQASLNNGIALHADYQFVNSGFFAGATYFYANPIAGPCTTAVSHEHGMPCISQTPPNTNPDDTLPGFAMSTFDEAYLGYKLAGFSGKLGDQIFNSAWAGPSDSRLKPNAFQGGDLAYTSPNGWSVEGADMWLYENRTSSTFNSETLLTSYPAGSPGLPSNIYVPGGQGINTAGFAYGKLAYAPKDANYSVDGTFYGVSNLVTMFWGDGRYNFTQFGSKYKPYIALQGGWENNNGNSYIGKIQSSDIGVQIGAQASKNVAVSLGFDDVPWKYDTISTAYLGSALNWTCSTSNDQLVSAVKNAAGSRVVVSTLPYFLPTNSGQCSQNANGTTTIGYGGWASPYTDSYATDPFFTTSISQGMPDRRSPGTSFKLTATYTSDNKKWVFLASDATYNYGNQFAPETTNEWDLDGQYHFSAVTKAPYKGLILRYRYAQRSLSNTFCGASSTTCPGVPTFGSSYLGGAPLFKYNRAQLEYDF
jgi:hypothetical protein